MSKGFFRRHRAGASVVAIAVALASVYGFRKIQYFAADPMGEKNCIPMPQGIEAGQSQPRAIAPLDTVHWAQVGGTINDASCLNRVDVYGIVDIRSEKD